MCKRLEETMVATGTAKKTEKIRKNLQKTQSNYIGNNKIIKLNENNKDIMIVGNNCSVEVKKNNGQINLTGDNFVLRINGGDGNVSAVGNNGTINLGNSDIKCNFVGKNITINDTIRPNGMEQSSRVRNGNLNVESQENLHIFRR